MTNKMQDKDETTKTQFGFEPIELNQKSSKVNEVFGRVANKYDLMNDLMSLGIQRLWKSKFCAQISNLNSDILDAAGGTGDIGFRILERAKKQNKSPKIVIADANNDMLRLALDKVIDLNVIDDISVVNADAENLPFMANSFDYYTVSFGVRNFTDINKALREAYRVLKPGGKFLCLEFSKVTDETIAKFYNFYSFNIIPKLGKLILNDSASYKYLVESIALFPNQNHFRVMLQNTGFAQVKYQNMSFGIVSIYSGFKI